LVKFKVSEQLVTKRRGMAGVYSLRTFKYSRFLRIYADTAATPQG